jgi:predicted MFS family arabinose efflux permease
MSAQDPAGRVAGMSVFSQTAGMAVGPSLGGVLVVAYGYGSVSILGIVAYVISTAVLVILAVRSRKIFA